jgi:cytochrome oxidase Cu insertion factor (SCO1/SenC/PrrC family)
MSQKLHFTSLLRWPSTGRMKKIVVSWLVCVLGLVLLFAWIGSDLLPRAGDKQTDNPLIRADFTLQTANNQTVRSDDLRGKYLLVYFGFTHCPDICPTTLLLMSNAVSQLGSNAQKIQPLFISVDPERDTPDAAAEYAGHFSKNFLGLSGTPEQIKLAADSFKVYYSKVEDKGSALGYVVDHSGFIYLMGTDGSYITHFASNVSEAELKKELQRYVH